MFAFALSLALRFPRLASFIKRFWKYILLAVAIIGFIVSFNVWLGNRDEANQQIGFSEAETQYTALVDASNEREAATQGRLNKMVVAFGAITTQREQAINLTVRPQIERINNEIATNPIYRECAATGGVLDDLNAGRSSIDASIAASNPRAD